MIIGTLKSQVDKLWDTFWTGGVSNPLTVIEQITYLIFIRRMDEKQQAKEKQANLLGLPLEDPFYTEDQRELRWNHFKNIGSPEEMFRLFQREDGIFDHMKKAGTKGGVFSQHMKGATFMITTPKLLDQVVQMVSGLEMDNRDTMGDLYEYLLGKIAAAGANGQFRTPRHIIKMMVDMMQPKATDSILDPSCGTAGFLVAASEYFKDNHKDLFLDKSFLKHYNSEMFLGVEFDPTMLRIGAMNLQLHGIEHPQLIASDALSEANAGLKDKATLVLANPPFKGSLDYDGVEKGLLSMVKTKKTELLFLALMLRAMETGGRCAVIIPDGVLFGSSKAHKQIRKEIIESNRLDAIISMPSGVFKPYAGVSTAIIIFTKTGTGGTKNVMFYDMKADGFSLDDKRNPVKENDIPDILEKWTAFQVTAGKEILGKRTEAFFTVPLSEIQENNYDLSINRYKEIVYEEIVYDAPKVIIKEIERIDKERNEALNVLKEMLG